MAGQHTGARDTDSFLIYHAQWEHAKGPLFVLHDGPPYANGDLHMGEHGSCAVSSLYNA